MCLNFMMYYPRLNFTKCVGFDHAGAAFANKYGGGYVHIARFCILEMSLLRKRFTEWKNNKR